MAELRTDLTNSAYHASPGLSASGAKMLIPPECPALFKWAQDHPKYKDTFDFGSLVHKLVLDDPQEQIVEVEADSWRTKAAREMRQAAREAGQIPALTKDLDTAREMVEVVRQHELANHLLTQPGKVEPSVFWTDERTGVDRRARFDLLPDPDAGRVVVPDYKTTVCAEPDKFARTAMDYGYHQQMAWYIDAVRALELADDIGFVFVAQEKTAPYLVNVIELDVVAHRIGDLLNRQAIETYKHCTDNDDWPGYGSGVAYTPLPGWYERQYEKELENV